MVTQTPEVGSGIVCGILWSHRRLGWGVALSVVYYGHMDTWGGEWHCLWYIVVTWTPGVGSGIVCGILWSHGHLGWGVALSVVYCGHMDTWGGEWHCLWYIVVTWTPGVGSDIVVYYGHMDAWGGEWHCLWYIMVTWTPGVGSGIVCGILWSHGRLRWGVALSYIMVTSSTDTILSAGSISCTVVARLAEYHFSYCLVFVCTPAV